MFTSRSPDSVSPDNSPSTPPISISPLRIFSSPSTSSRRQYNLKHTGRRTIHEHHSEPLGFNVTKMPTPRVRSSGAKAPTDPVLDLGQPPTFKNTISKPTTGRTRKNQTAGTPRARQAMPETQLLLNDSQRLPPELRNSQDSLEKPTSLNADDDPTGQQGAGPVRDPNPPKSNPIVVQSDHSSDEEDEDDGDHGLPSGPGQNHSPALPRGSAPGSPSHGQSRSDAGGPHRDELSRYNGSQLGEDSDDDLPSVDKVIENTKTHSWVNKNRLEELKAKRAENDMMAAQERDFAAAMGMSNGAKPNGTTGRQREVPYADTPWDSVFKATTRDAERAARLFFFCYLDNKPGHARFSGAFTRDLKRQYGPAGIPDWLVTDMVDRLVVKMNTNMGNWKRDVLNDMTKLVMYEMENDEYLRDLKDRGAVQAYMNQKVWSMDNFNSTFRFTDGYINFQASPASVATWARLIFINVGTLMKMHIDYEAMGPDRPAESPWTRKSILDLFPKIPKSSALAPHRIDPSKIEVCTRLRSSRSTRQTTTIHNDIDDFVWAPPAESITRDEGHELTDLERLQRLSGRNPARKTTRDGDNAKGKEPASASAKDGQPSRKKTKR